jgi:hypothetical protein
MASTKINELGIYTPDATGSVRGQVSRESARVGARICFAMGMVVGIGLGILTVNALVQVLL